MLYQPQMRLNTYEAGQGLVEYALILILVSIVVVAALAVLGTEINVMFNDVSSVLATRP